MRREDGIERLVESHYTAPRMARGDRERKQAAGIGFRGGFGCSSHWRHMGRRRAEC